MTKPVRIPVPTAKTAPRRKKFSPVPLVPPRAVPARCRSIGPPHFWRQGTRQVRPPFRQQMRAYLVFLAAVLAAACGSVAGSGTNPSPSPSVPPGAVLVTMASDRQTVTAHVGDRIQIALGEQYTWQPDPAGRRAPHPPGPELPAGPRDAGDLARERPRPFDDQRDP